MSFAAVDGVTGTNKLRGGCRVCKTMHHTLYRFWSKAGGFLRRRCNMTRRANVRSKDIQRISMLGRIVGVTIAADWKGVRRR
jgi:hypothetical protein